MKKIHKEQNIKNFFNDGISTTDFSFALGSNMTHIGAGDQNLMEEFGRLFFITIHGI